MIAVGSGALNLDLIFEVGDINEISRAGFDLKPGRECVLDRKRAAELLKLLEKDGSLLLRSGGGSAANTICALSRMGHRCFFIGTVGEDEEGEFLIKSMGQVDCSLVTRCGTSSMCIVVVDKIRNDRAIAVVPGTVDIDAGHPKIKTVVKNASFFHISSLAHKEGPEIQGRLAGLCESGCTLSFDPGEVYASRGKKSIQDILDRTSLLFCSDTEFEQLFGKRSIMEVVSRGYFGRKASVSHLAGWEFFRRMGYPVLAKKSGAKGALLASATAIYQCPARHVEKIVDNTGAGDAFDAGLIDAISKNKGPKEALEDAVSVAAFSLMFPGRSWIDYLGEVVVTGRKD